MTPLTLKECLPFPDPKLTLIEVAALHGAAICMADKLRAAPPRSGQQKRLAAALLTAMKKLRDANLNGGRE